MDLREKFYEANIPYDDLDQDLIPILDILNFQYGIKTEYSCVGHNINEKGYILFDKEVTDDQIFKIHNRLLAKNSCTQYFYKWLRSVDSKSQANWVIEFPAFTNEVRENEYIDFFNKEKMNSLSLFVSGLK